MIIDNIFYFIDYKQLSVYEFSNKIGVSNGYLFKTKKNKGNVGGHILEKIVSQYPEINPKWLLTGSGAMLRDVDFEAASAENTNQVFKTDLPVLSTSVKNTAIKKEVPQPATLYLSKLCKGVTSAFEVLDHSMSPNYKKGSFVFLEELPNNEIIVFDKDYIIETKKIRFLKNIKVSDQQQSFLCESYNNELHPYTNKPIYDSFYIDKEEVVKIYRVVASIEFNK